jgi:putative transposase
MERLYHAWFSTKGRMQALDGEVGDEVKRLLIETAQRTGIRLLEVELVADHSHLLIAVTGTQTLPSVMHRLKGASARFIFLKYPELKVDFGHNSFWQKGYGWRKITPEEVPAIRQYIGTQRRRNLRREH